MPGVRVARGESLNGFEMDWHTPQGIRSLLLFTATLPAMHGHPATCVEMFQDINKLKQAEKALQQGNDRLKLLSETASDLLSSEQPLALLASLFRKLSAQMDLDVYFSYLVDENRQAMRLASYSGFSEELAKENEWLELGQAVCGTVAQQRCQIAIGNVQQSTDPKTELIRFLGITAYSCQPLMAQGRLFGTLGFQQHVTKPIEPAELAAVVASLAMRAGKS